ncbi:MAG TPA: hypothetical protein PLV06_09895 [Bacteroidales bacterium]|nr:hypothetical protein [Bacteroidales bacterium]HPF04266.1 hypothetical protein [Bacteroidales bacterium]HPJ59868.1 hypothetical protein [Bacteroidales bacterium]HPR12684.1 hypothetical protein [Bacteroidales bacterium]HRW86031.1 hypothetical protein [Bacteroidales bacterium]
MFIKLLILSGIIVIIAFVFLAIRILFSPGGRFPEIHVGRNRELRKRGISCARSTDTGCNPIDSNDGCPTCGIRSSQINLINES